MNNKIIIFSIAVICVLTSCNRGFEPIEFGKEACANCKMTIVDRHYAAEMVTKKGRVYKFDDVLCMKKYIEDNKMSAEVGKLYVANYKDIENGMLDARKVVFLHDDYFHTPMNGDCAAFVGIAEAQSLKDSVHAKVVTWNNLN